MKINLKALLQVLLVRCAPTTAAICTSESCKTIAVTEIYFSNDDDESAARPLIIYLGDDHVESAVMRSRRVISLLRIVVFM